MYETVKENFDFDTGNIFQDALSVKFIAVKRSSMRIGVSSCRPRANFPRKILKENPKSKLLRVICERKQK